MTGAGVQSGNLGRWFEQICRIEHAQLQEIVVAKRTSQKPGILPHRGGVYAFWWTGSIDMLRDDAARSIALHGPGGKKVYLKFDDEWLGLSTGLPVPLYVGKTAASIAKRIGQHLRLKDERMLSVGQSLKKKKHPTTSCQLRGGIDHIFPNTRFGRRLQEGRAKSAAVDRRAGRR